MRPTSSLSFIASGPEMRAIIGRIDTAAASSSTVLLIGETGVGKELLAEYIHRTSDRNGQPFVKVGLAALPPDLLESELFGHERGAYTGATAEKKGLFEMADGGTIFLDDIDDFPLPLQSKLLRVLESMEILRVGGTKVIPIDVRVVCASKIDLRLAVDHGTFRPDLYYRINVVPVEIPPLRKRRDDIPLLVNFFLDRYRNGKGLRISDAAFSSLVRYDWPGNIRELRNVIQRAALFTEGTIIVKDLPAEVQQEGSLEGVLKACSRCLSAGGMSFVEVVECLETNLIRQALQDSGWNQSQAARSLKMSLSTLRDKLKKYHITPGEPHECRVE